MAVLPLQAGETTAEAPVFKSGEGLDAPAEGFTKLSELFRWAVKSSFGGGGISTYRLGDRDVHVVSRSFTSGRASMELSFYVQQPDSKGLQRILHLARRPVEVRTRQDEEAIVIEQYDFRKGAWVTAMTVTKSIFDT